VLWVSSQNRFNRILHVLNCSSRKAPNANVLFGGSA
jgi:hypothetical protein